MREFGEYNAVFGYVLCEVKECRNNREMVPYASVTSKTMATGHELLHNDKGHSAVIVYFDQTHRISLEVEKEILKLTGVSLPREAVVVD